MLSKFEDGMRRAVKLWDTSTYWTDRAAGAIRNAKHKERSDVRARRIKGLEADQRKQERIIAAPVHARILAHASRCLLISPIGSPMSGPCLPQTVEHWQTGTSQRRAALAAAGLRRVAAGLTSRRSTRSLSPSSTTKAKAGSLSPSPSLSTNSPGA